MLFVAWVPAAVNLVATVLCSLQLVVAPGRPDKASEGWLANLCDCCSGATATLQPNFHRSMHVGWAERLQRLPKH